MVQTGAFAERSDGRGERVPGDIEEGQKARKEKTPPERGSSWSEWSDSNTRPPRPERGALPDCATLRDQRRFYRTAYLVAQAPNSKKPGEFLTVT